MRIGRNLRHFLALDLANQNVNMQSDRNFVWHLQMPITIICLQGLILDLSFVSPQKIVAKGTTVLSLE